MSIEGELDKILINNLDNSRNVWEFLRAIHGAKAAGFSALKLDFSEVQSVFPNAAVPISGLIERCRLDRLEMSRTKLHYGRISTRLQKAGFDFRSAQS